MARSNRKPNTELAIVPVPEKSVVVVPPSVNQSKKKKKKKGKKKKAAKKLTERELFFRCLTRPDVFGPIRTPRFGSSDRTGLGYDISIYTITGSAANTVIGVQMLPYFNNAFNTFAVANTTTGFGGPGVASVGQQFPAVNQIADINITGGCFVMYYTGNPLNVQGEVIIGCTIPVATTATYNSMYYYPGTIQIPVADLISKPLAVALRKLSPVADQFTPVASGNQDIDLPFVFTSGLPTGGTLVVKSVRSWEYRSTTVSGLVVPYEKVGANHSSDVLAYQDARADIAAMPAPVSDAEPNYISSVLDFMGFKTLPSALMSAAGTAASLAMQHHMTRAQQARPFALDMV